MRPYSPSQQELPRIYEDGALNNNADLDDDIADIMERLSQTDIKNRPTPAQVRRYLLWLEQNYHSPYTGEMIPLAKLFTAAYEIEHVIPQSRYYDDSLSNKVICEAEVNKLKAFNEKTILGQVADTAIQKILLRRLQAKGSAELASSPDGIEEMNANIQALNGAFTRLSASINSKHSSS